MRSLNNALRHQLLFNADGIIGRVTPLSFVWSLGLGLPSMLHGIVRKTTKTVIAEKLEQRLI